VIAHGLRGRDNVGLLLPGGPMGTPWSAAGFAGIPLHGHDDTVIGVLAVAHDRVLPLDDATATMLRIFATIAGAEIERRHLESQKRRLAAEMEQRVARRTAVLSAANSELQAFADSLSHDLSAPLRQISGFATLLDDIVAAARSTSVLVERMRDFSRAARLDLRRAEVDLGQIAHEVVAELSKDVPHRVIDWNIGVLPRVPGDPVLLRQVVVNLLSNAVKYSAPCNLACIEVGVLRSETPDEIVCFVRDNGVGFDMRYVHQLFGVFRRLHPDTAFEGTGLGLANVRRIVHRHGGRVWATGEVGGGATFFFALPVVDGRQISQIPDVPEWPRAS
jgi:light-regulated signal transduction histidine kinase (bacteriophytochrome)